MNNPQMEPESEKEFYDQLGEELMPLLNQLNELEIKIQMVTNAKPPRWGKRRWQRCQAKDLSNLYESRTKLLQPIGHLNDLRAKSTYGRLLQSERDKAKNSRRQSEKTRPKIDNVKAIPKHLKNCHQSRIRSAISKYNLAIGTAL